MLRLVLASGLTSESASSSGLGITHVIYAFLTMCAIHPADTDKDLLEQIKETCKNKPAFTAIVADQKAAYGFTLADGKQYEGHFEQFKALKVVNPHLYQSD